MCGRYATTRSSADLAALFEAADETGGVLVPDYNVAPTDPTPVIRVSARAGGRVVSAARWGLVPPWAKDTRGAARMINARAETVETSRAFARPFAERRCLVPVDGWYEWVRDDAGGKQAYFMTPTDGGPLALAGLWSVWGNAEQRVLTCTVLTTAAVDELALVHHRMPLALPPRRWAEWLSGRDVAAADLLAPPPADLLAGLELRPVGARVGDVRNDGPELIDRVPGRPLHRPADIDADLTLF
ncbi:MAG TPA: SOS response-associated peptidase [Micromonosporaceae bacterium]|nr:SOS response-associated peptidase [Micromonosporaceae bacterium]